MKNNGGTYAYSLPGKIKQKMQNSNYQKKNTNTFLEDVVVNSEGNKLRELLKGRKRAIKDCLTVNQVQESYPRGNDNNGIREIEAGYKDCL